MQVAREARERSIERRAQRKAHERAQRNGQDEVQHISDRARKVREDNRVRQSHRAAAQAGVNSAPVGVVVGGGAHNRGPSPKFGRGDTPRDDEPVIMDAAPHDVPSSNTPSSAATSESGMDASAIASAAGSGGRGVGHRKHGNRPPQLAI